MKKLNKNQKRLIRIIGALLLYIPLYVVNEVLEPKFQIMLPLFLVVYLFIGYDVLWRALRNILHGQIFDENFLMVVATIGAFGVGEYPEAVAVMLFYQVGELFQDYAVGKSRRSISSLMDIRPDTALRLNGEEREEILPEDVKIQDILIVKAGERIPVDGVLDSTDCLLDMSALSGESVPRAFKKGDEVLSGSINVSGEIRIIATKEYFDSTVAHILDMVENASQRKAKAENFITRFAKYYTPLVVGTAVVLAVIPPIFDGLWINWLTRALTFLVISCPCALVISVPMSFFGGVGSASKEGVLFKGSSYLEMIDKAKVFVFDKTGTLTHGTFKVQKVIPESRRDEILAVASLAERGSIHPIAKSILREVKDIPNESYEIKEYIGRGIEAKNAEHDIIVGNGRLLIEKDIAIIPVDDDGTIVYVAKDNEYLGAIVVSDTIREDAKEVIDTLKKEGAKTIMLTGDNEKYAREVQEKLQIDEVKYNLLPADKVVEMEAIMESKDKNAKVVYVGDGVNDAPVLMRADIGISMGGVGSDSAVEASDMVLMHDNMHGILDAKRISKKTIKLVYENIVFILLVKALVLILGALGIANMWLAVFADVGVAVLATLNSLRSLKAK